MGKQNRRKKRNYAGVDRLTSRQRLGLAAERRGRQLPPELAAYQQVLETRGIEGVKEGLYSRHNQRWTNIAFHGDQLVKQVLPILAPAAIVQTVAETAGADRTRSPAFPYGEFSDQVAWGVDSLSSAARLLLVGQAFGAAAILRSQLERWTFNLAWSQGMSFGWTELGSDQMNVVWRIHDQNIDAVEIWSHLSELLHGRGPLLDVAKWEADDLMAGEPPEGMATLTAAMTPAIVQLRSLALRLASDAQLAKGMDLLRNWPDTIPIEVPRDFPIAAMSGPALWPLLYSHVVEETLLMLVVVPPSARLCACRHSLVMEGKGLFRVGELPAIVLADNRFRAWQSAARAFEAEHAETGDLFNPDVLAVRAQQLILTAEVATLSARWASDLPGADALWIAASALRSGFFLWLEDDDRALACVRTGLESIARARTWRMHPKRAVAMASGR